MNRRELLAGSSVGILAASGCLGGRGTGDGAGSGGTTADEDDVPGCTWKAEWTDDVTDGPADADPESIAGRRDCSTADRPEPAGDVCRTFDPEGEDGADGASHSVGVASYPEPPESFDDETVTSYVAEYERVYARNAAVARYGDRVVGISVGVDEDETQVLDRDDEIAAVRIEFGVGLRIRSPRSDGSYSEDRLGEAAVYGIDETGVVRAETEYDEAVPEETADPVADGELLQCF